MTRILLLVLSCVFFAVQAIPAQVTSQIHYQGVLKDASDQPVQGAQNLTFRLYDVESGGTALWTESQTVTLIAGSFSAVLGSVTPLANVTFNRPYWLGVSVNGQAEMTPRVALIPVPYSLNTRSIPDRIVTSGKIAAGTVVRSVNGLRDSVTLEGRGNVAVTQEGNKVVISSTAASGTGNNGVAGVQSINALTGSVALVAGSSNVTITQDTTGVAKQIVIAVTASSATSNTGNTISGLHSTVGGGTENRVTDDYGTVAGGRLNRAGNDTIVLNDMTYATVSGGGENTASGAYATVPGGRGNIASGLYSFAAGRRAQAKDNGTFVWADDTGQDFASTGAGQFLIRARNGVGINTNTLATGAALTVEGDIVLRSGAIRYAGNSVTAAFGSIGGGGRTIPTNASTGNKVTDTFGTISGGGNNQAGNGDNTSDNASFATVSGGRDNTAGGVASTIPGGANNSADGNYSFAAGRNAHADNRGSFVWASGGGINEAFHSNADNQFLIRAAGGVGIGTNEIPDGIALNVAGTIKATTVLQGANNSVSGSRSTIGGGINNSTFDNLSTVGGGRGNVAGTDDGTNNNSLAATVSGGESNKAQGNYATVAGGESNTVDANHGTVSGGVNNKVSGGASVIVGGSGNEIPAANLAFIGGGGGPNAGMVNKVFDRWGVVVGGRGNQAGTDDQDIASRMYATVGGGQNNSASGEASTVPGGRQNEADGTYSFAAGNRAKANHDGSFVWADGENEDFASSDNNQFLIRAVGGVGIGTSETEAQMTVMGQRNDRVLDLQIDKRQGIVGFSDIFAGFYTTANNGSKQYQGGIRARANANGVNLHSPTGDFAEYLKKLNANEQLKPGDIVGVFGGKITRQTEGAHHLMVVTDRAIISGNAPPEGEMHLWEEVAFIGQVPVKVTGFVQAGDYILISTKGDGVGVAIAPDKMRSEDYAHIVGRAWASSKEASVKRVNAVVGLAMNQMGKVAASHAKMESLEKQNAELVNRIATLEAMVQKIARHSGVNAQTASLEK